MNLAEANKMREAIAALRRQLGLLELRVSNLEPSNSYDVDNTPRLGKFHVEPHPTVIAKRPVGRPRKS